MTKWSPQKVALKRPFHLAIANNIAQAIEAGEAPEGARLPTHRRLAGDLGVSVHTVSKAYDDLRRRGLIAGAVGRGTFVVGQAPLPRTPYEMERREDGLVDLSIARPATDTVHIRRMGGALQALSTTLDPRTYLSCRPNAGLDSHRETAVAWLDDCGLPAQPRNVLITNGVSHGMTLALTTLARPGDLVVSEALGCHLLMPMCSFLGLRLQGLPLDTEGILPDAFEAACRAQTVRVLFTVPTLANPTVTVMSAARRTAIVEIARRHKVSIVEDDVWGPLPGERVTPLCALAPEIGVYLTSFTKCVMPGLRAGYLVAPERLIPSLTGRLIAMSWMGTPLVAELASRWVRDGTAIELVDWQRDTMAQRHASARRILDGLEIRGHRHSLHLWLNLPENWRAEELLAHARANGVAIAAATPFLADPRQPVNAVRVALGAPATLADLEAGLGTLAELLARDPEPLPLAV
jgi:DNA-binding transcriptional MocR family regulator